MLRYANPEQPVSLSMEEVAAAVSVVAQSILITSAEDAGIQLTSAAFNEYSSRINKIIQDPHTVLSPGDLVRHAEGLCARGAQAVIARGEAGFRKNTWGLETVDGVWPFFEEPDRA